MKIAVIEDDKNISMGLRLNFSSLNHDVTCYENGLSAFNDIVNNNNTFDLLITDLYMPKMTGLEFIEKLKMEKINVPILVISGYGDIETIKKLKSLGVQNFVHKPFSFADIKQEIEWILA